MPRYVVNMAASGGATIRAAPASRAAVLGRLKPGDDWEGETVDGQLLYVKGYGSSNAWVSHPTRGFVWSGLLMEVR